MKTIRLHVGKERALARRHPWVFEGAIVLDPPKLAPSTAAAPIELKGHAYADVGANGAAMVIEGVGDGQYIHLAVQRS